MAANEVFDLLGEDDLEFLEDTPTDHGTRLRLVRSRETLAGVLIGKPPDEPIIYQRPPTPEEETPMPDLKPAMAALKEIDGYIAAGIVDSASGMALAHDSSSKSFDIEAACALNTNVVKAKLKAADALKLDTAIEDILITLGTQYHLIRPLRDRPTVFAYLAVDRDRANLAMARMSLGNAEERIQL